MDRATLAAYDAAAAAYAQEWEAQPAPIDLHDLVERFFRPGLTADIGCGSGRDAAWLTANGFPTVGYDPSAGLLGQARAAHPGVTFEQAALPELHGIGDDTFDNVLCETVLMHLAREDIAPAVRRMLAVLKRGGILALSWRVEETDRRDELRAALFRLRSGPRRARVVRRDGAAGRAARLPVVGQENPSPRGAPRRSVIWPLGAESKKDIPKISLLTAM